MEKDWSKAKNQSRSKKTGLKRSSPVFGWSGIFIDRSWSWSYQKYAKDRTGPDFQALIRISLFFISCFPAHLFSTGACVIWKKGVAVINHNLVLLVQKLSDIFDYMQRQGTNQSSASVPLCKSHMDAHSLSDTPLILTDTSLLPTMSGRHLPHVEHNSPSDSMPANEGSCNYHMGL